MVNSSNSGKYKIKHNKTWTEVQIPGGGTIKVRAAGQEFKRALAGLISDKKVEAGFVPSALSSMEALGTIGAKEAAGEPSALTGRIVEALITSYDSPFTKLDAPVLSQLSADVLLSLVLKFSTMTVAEVQELDRVAAVGTTFGGYSGEFLADENDQPIPDRDSAGHLDVEACVTVLGIDEVWEVYFEAVKRLTSIRDQRFEDAAKNLKAPTAGMSDGAPN